MHTNDRQHARAHSASMHRHPPTATSTRACVHKRAKAYVRSCTRALARMYMHACMQQARICPAYLEVYYLRWFSSSAYPNYRPEASNAYMLANASYNNIP
jgi:hypothetical protein